MTGQSIRRCALTRLACMSKSSLSVVLDLVWMVRPQKPERLQKARMSSLTCPEIFFRRHKSVAATLR